MALTGLQIFKLMPKTNCKDCGHPTCLAFSMALASAKIALDACPHVSAEAKESLGSASAPPVTKVTFGVGDKARETGDETVLFRHDKQFFHPTCLAVTIDDNDPNFNARLETINDLMFERVGEKVSIDAIALIDKSGEKDSFVEHAKIIADKGKFAPIYISNNAEALAEAAAATKAAKPLLYGATADNWEAVAKAAKEADCPLVVTAANINDLGALTEKVGAVTKNLIIGATAAGISQRLADLTQIRRQAIRKKVRPLGYPSIISVVGTEPRVQVAEASIYIAKYGSIVVTDVADKASLLPLCALRQNLFSNPQVPAQVEPGVFAVGEADANSPVYCTTNFSLTYYTVEGEVSSSKIPSWIIATPTDGTSVLTAWAAGKFTADKIAEFIAEIKLEDKVNHKVVVIPGHVAVLKAPLEEKSGWKVLIASNEASGIPAFAKEHFAK
ncbi:acetyl-CoA synthase subunit gamma [Synergistales bacterium]|nr:acetyl-CoA synthase subunit gamma [Synergistales bacterium]